ncbi:MAG: cytochrome c3 family protein [Acidobacteria bacterium]|nr:cytochrome c3 family protein [Acidobacteriota bacterium]
MRLVQISVLAMAAVAVRGDAPDGPFSHRKHAALKLKCTVCHTGAEAAERARFPTVAQCRVCHTEIADRKIPLRRVLRLPDLVFFSHARHVAAKLECSGCHGDVAGMDVMKVGRGASMKDCIACHKEHRATIVCTACHELSQ